MLGFEIQESEDAGNVYLVKDGTLFLLYGLREFARETGKEYGYAQV